MDGDFLKLGHNRNFVRIKFSLSVSFVTTFCGSGKRNKTSTKTKCAVVV